MREIKCELCGQVVIKLAPGSLIKPGLSIVCPRCLEGPERAPVYGEDTVDYLRGLFGMK
jgi:hypothetical protein